MPDSSPTKNDNTCEHCSGQLTPIRFGGLCPRCLFSEVITGISADDHPALHSIAITGKCPTTKQLDAEIAGLKFQRMIGRGASGWTFLATQISLAREVAVKILPRKLRTDRSVERFRLEAENLAKLNHPRIVTAHDFGSTTNNHYIVMEYVAGQTLRMRMQHQTFTAEEAIGIVRQICEAAAYAHSKGLLHRDIKPENVLFVGKSIEDGIKVADFGISKLTDQSTTHQNLTYTGVTMGTPFYMAPEQSIVGQADARADVYSIGVLFYELLTGRLPLGRFRAPSSFGGSGRKLDKVVFRALANSPEDRFQSANEFITSLDEVKSSGLYWKPVALGLLAVGLLAGLLLSIGVLVSLIANSFAGWSTQTAQATVAADAPKAVQSAGAIPPKLSNMVEPAPLAAATKVDAAVQTKGISEVVASDETEENPFVTGLVPVRTSVGTKARHMLPAPTTPDPTANQLMLEHVKWSVVPIEENAEKPKTNINKTNRIVSFPPSLSSKSFHGRLSDIVFDRDRKSAIATISNAFEEFSELILIDVLNGNVRSRHKLPAEKCLPIGVSSDGTRAVTLEQGWARKQGKISFWSTRGKELKLDDVWMTSAPFDREGFSPESGMLLDDQHLLTFGKRVILWDLVTASPVYSYQCATQPKFEPNSGRLTFRNGSSIWIVDATTGKVLGAIDCEPELSSLAFSSSGNMLAGCSRTGSVWIWDLADGKIRNSGNTPNSRAGAVQWAGDEHLIVDGQYLIDVRLGVAVWKYERTSNPLHRFSSDRFWIASNSALRPVRLPHKTMEDMTEIEPEQLIVLRPGMSVALKTDLVFDDQECKDINGTLENKLKDMGVSIDASSELSLVASVVAGKKQPVDLTAWDDPFGRRGKKTISITPHVSSLSLQRDGQTLWKRQVNHSVAAPIHPQRAETLEQAAIRMCRPSPSFFTSAKLPRNLKALPNEFTVGKSSLTP